MLNLEQSGGGTSGGGGVTSFTGDSVAYNNSASTGAVTLSLISQIKNTFFAGPSAGVNAAPTWRVLVIADLPTAIPNANLANASITINGDGAVLSSPGATALGATAAFTLLTQLANKVFAGPTSGGALAPTFRSLVAGDIPNIAESQVTNLTTDLAAKQATLTGTGLARQAGACTELSGDVTTSGTNAATVVKVNGAAVPASATILGSNGSGQLVDNSANLANVKIATLTLTAAQIKALNGIAIQIIAAPGAGLAINVWYVVWNYIAGGTGYATVTGTFQLADSGLHFTIAGITGTNLGIANAATNGLGLVSGAILLSVDTSYVNTSRVVWISTASPTTGNGTIAVKVFYTIDTVS